MSDLARIDRRAWQDVALGQAGGGGDERHAFIGISYTTDWQVF